MFGRKAAFWIAVGGTAVAANFVLVLAATQLPLPGLRRFVNFVNKGEC